MPDAAGGPGQTDGHHLGAAFGRLGSAARRSAKSAAMIAASHLDPGEMVEMVAAGRFLGADAVIVVTNERMLVANDRDWEPDVVPVALEGGLSVQGWHDGRHAVLRFARAGVEIVVDRISDAEIARQIATVVRERSGG